MTEAGALIRLFPVPFRLIADDQQFRKWQWIRVLMEKSRDDHRPESHRIYIDKIECDTDPLPSGKEGWRCRMELLRKVPIHDDFAKAEHVRQRTDGSLAMVRPARILGLNIRPARNPEWTPEEPAKLTQMQRQSNLFPDEEETHRQVALLQKIPFDFYYRYECMVDDQRTVYCHKLVDWEVGALYRRLLKQHGAAGWETPFREKYERQLPSRDLILLMGTMHRFPDQWLIISVICPPKLQPETPNQPGLF